MDVAYCFRINYYHFSKVLYNFQVHTFTRPFGLHTYALPPAVLSCVFYHSPPHRHPSTQAHTQACILVMSKRAIQSFDSHHHYYHTVQHKASFTLRSKSCQHRCCVCLIICIHILNCSFVILLPYLSPTRN